ncbi:MAG: FHA domain-containing protein [Kiritimatiellae bacterium]|nr:FHA domain-containing protein [Kiritimatiellia bacterium]
MACLIVMDGPLKGQRVALDQPVIRIGRKEGNGWVLPDGSVSGTHCEIEKSETGFLIRDLGSTNGTKVNNEPVKEKPLFRNDIIMMGEIPVMIEGDDVPQTDKPQPYAIPRTTIVIQQKHNIEPPKEFAKKSNSNKIWVALIALLLLVIGGLFYLFIKGSQSAG